MVFLPPLHVVRASTWQVCALAVAAVFVSAAGDVRAQSEPPRPTVEIGRGGFNLGAWPADFNENGRTDLIGANKTGYSPVVSLGVILDIGTSSQEFRSLGIDAIAIGVADFNNDGHMDVVLSGVAILPGNGDGTFGDPVAVTGPPAPGLLNEIVQDALTSDLNGDGNRDLVVGGGAVMVYPGNGDFTFGSPVALPLSSYYGQFVTSADFDADGNPDLAVAIYQGFVDVFLNRGAFLFTPLPVVMPIAGFLWSIASADFNGDSHPDLVVTTGAEGNMWSAGKFFLLFGNGDGTFQPPETVLTGTRGSITIVTGDFNNDGIVDVATGNRSWIYRDTSCAPLWNLWDSVTIVPGRGDGTFGSPATFRLSDEPFGGPSDPDSYADTHNALRVADVNGDGRLDLIPSGFETVYTHPPAPNRVPTIDASAIDLGNNSYKLLLTFSEPDHDWIDFEWRDDTGALIGSTMQFCRGFQTSTRLTVTATDARGGVATDTVDVIRPGGSSTPYGGVPAAVPGTIEAENFDEGGLFNAYYDLDGENLGGAYRSTGVDIGVIGNGGGKYYVGWTQPFEWLKYTVDVATEGSYTLETRVANVGTGASFHVEADGVNVTGPIALPDTGRWEKWEWIRTPDVALAAGQHVLRVVFDTAGPTGEVGRYDRFRLRLQR